MITRICENCHQSYQTFPSIRLRFCSNKCAGEFKRTGQYVACVQCGTKFWATPARSSRFCSHSCAMTARNLSDANPSFHRDISGENNPMFGKGLFGAANPMYGKRKEQSKSWKGGRRTRKDGYVVIRVSDDYPFPSYESDGAKYALEHRFVMETHLGRFLLPEEVVHHINENPSDNRIENLQLFENQAEHVRIGHGRSSSTATESLA